MRKLGDYVEISGDDFIEALRTEAAKLEGKSFVHVNSTFYGGGVAEMLTSYIPLMNGLGINMEWRMIKGNREFFLITKKLHNALQGKNAMLSPEETELFERTVEANSQFTNLRWYDSVIIDDPQPCALINHYPRTSPAMWKPLPMLLELETYQRKQPWIWRAHIDLSTPNPAAFEYLNRFLSKYDAAIISDEKYGRKISKPKFVIQPAIDPLSDKNRPLKSGEIARILDRHGIKRDLPIIAQVSRFDQWKDPVGVIKAFKLVRRRAKCQLVLLGSHASDDPESERVFRDVFRAAEKEEDITLISLQSDLLVNALQTEAAVVVQKSIREGFGLTVSEALWKGTPVVGSKVGGIPSQIDDGHSGYLVRSVKETADRILHLLRNPRKAAQMGLNGREKVRQNFLLPRLIMEEIGVLNEMTALDKTIKPPRAVEQVLKLLRRAPRLATRGFELLTNR